MAISRPRSQPDVDDERLGARIRALRTERGRSLRATAAELGISASALSQIETGRMRPSVTRLYQIVSLLDASLDALFVAPGPVSDDAPSEELEQVTVLRSAELPTLMLEQGVRWRRLNPVAIPGLEVLEVVYEPGSCSSARSEYLRHMGREIGSVVSGNLQVDVGFETHDLGPGDSIMFPSTTPHRVFNHGSTASVAIWVTQR